MKKCLLVIDMQKGLDDSSFGKRNNPSLEQNVELLIAKFRKDKLDIIHIKHCSLEANSPLKEGEEGNQYKKEATPLSEEKQFKKTVNSAFIGTELETYLHKQNIKSLVIVGLTTDHCVSTTTRMAANLGFDVELVSDATATFERKSYDGTFYDAEQMHKINLASLHGEFCNVVKTKSLI